MADVSVRPARPDDVAEIARIQVDTWRFGYASIVPAAVLDTITIDTAAAVWTQAVTARPSPRHHVLVALEQDTIVGFTALGPATEDDLQPEDPEPETLLAIAPILVDPR